MQKGAKVKLAPNTTVVGRLRAGDDLKTDLPDKAGDVTHTDAVGYVYTIHERETVPSSVSRHITQHLTELSVLNSNSTPLDDSRIWARKP